MTRCVVVGAGIVGMLTARELLLAGCDVTVVERGQPGRESSWAGGGILSPLYPWRYPDSVSELARWGQQRYANLCEALEQSSGVDPQWTRNGMLLTDCDEAAAAGAWAERFSARLESVDPGQAKRLEPQLGPNIDSVLWMPDVAQVRNPRLAQALRISLAQGGVAMLTDCPALEWKRDAGRISGLRTAAGDLEADLFVVATGAWTSGLLEPTGLRLPIEPVRGQMILFRGPPELLKRITLCRGHYVIPRRDGRVLVGSTLEYVGFDKKTTAEALTQLKQAAFDLAPALGNLPVELHWAGLRPGSPSGVPVIGAHPEISNLFVCAGHFRNGVVLAPASARLAADLMLGREPDLEPSDYDPVRLG
jgi:glycine oxidase